MSIFTPQIAAAYGALDSDALVDDTPVSAYVGRELARAANRINSKGCHWFTLLWPSRDEPDASVDTPSDVLKKPFSATIWRAWKPILGPFGMKKKPGLTLAEMRMNAMIPGSDVIQIQVVTQAAPFVSSPSSSAPNLITITADGDDDWDDYTLDDLPVHHGAQETLTFYARSISQGAGGDTSTFGTPNSGDIGQAGTTVFYAIDTSWNSTEGNAPIDYASAGHYVVMDDDRGNEIATRDIISIAPPITYDGLATTHQQCFFSPEIAESQAGLITGGGFTIRKAGELACDSISFRLKGRTA